MFFQDPPFQLLNLGANFPFSFFGFGNPKEEGSYKTFVLRDVETGEFEVWATNRWSHVCISYQKSNGHLRVVKVRGRRDHQVCAGFVP